MHRHSTAPWKFYYDRHGKSSEICSGGVSHLHEPVAIIPHDDITAAGEKEMRANARLITHAPELYWEAVQAMIFLDDLQASDNPACDPNNPQAATFHMLRAALATVIANVEGRK